MDQQLLCFGDDKGGAQKQTEAPDLGCSLDDQIRARLQCPGPDGDKYSALPSAHRDNYLCSLT